MYASFQVVSLTLYNFQQAGNGSWFAKQQLTELAETVAMLRIVSGISRKFEGDL
jgi:hypothetical protein